MPAPTPASKTVRFVEDALQAAIPQSGPREVDDRAGGARHGDAVPFVAVLLDEGRGAVEFDAGMAASAAVAGNSDLNVTPFRSCELPEGCGGMVAQEGALASSQDRRQPATPPGEPAGADRVNPSVKADEPSGRRSGKRLVVRNAELDQLAASDEPRAVAEPAPASPRQQAPWRVFGALPRESAKPAPFRPSGHPLGAFRVMAPNRRQAGSYAGASAFVPRPAA